ncbi:MAG: hypothetical protein KBC46_02650 [Ferrovibrio sp.]|nr:hypothetical protein [Ferrovibrio sp.]
MTTLSATAQSAPLQAASTVASGTSPDNRLVEVSRILADTEGRYSDRDKAAAYKEWGAINYSNLFSYSLEDRKESQALITKAMQDPNSFLGRIEAVNQKYQAFVSAYDKANPIELRRSGDGSDVKRLDAYIGFLDGLSTQEKQLFQLDASYRQGLDDYDLVRQGAVALRDSFRVLDERAKAGAFQFGTSVAEVRDRQAQAALLLLEKIGANTKPQAFRQAVAEAAGLARETFGLAAVQDRVELSAAARKQLGL